MLEIRTLLKRGETFVDPEDFTGEVSDVDYIEGAIELSIDRRPLLSRAHWDYVDQLWAYLVEGLLQLQSGKVFSTFLPDQPIEIILTPEANGQRVKVQVKSKEKTVEANTHLPSFVSAMAKEARRFFERMQVLVPQYEPVLDDLTRLDAMLDRARR